MAKLVYSSIASLDGYVADADGDFSWATPDEEVHGFVNDEYRSIGTYLYGRRLYEVMRVWQTFGLDPDEAPVVRDFGQLWRAADKVVYSHTVTAPTTPRTLLRPRFDSDEVRQLVAVSPHDVAVGGPTLAADALRAGLVDEIHVYVVPHVVGAGTGLLPDGVRLSLKLLEEHRFRSGFVFLRYAVGN